MQQYTSTVMNRYKNFNNDTLEYDLDVLNLTSWIKNVLIEHISEVTSETDLLQLHTIISGPDIKRVQEKVYESFDTTEFRVKINKFYNIYIEPLLDHHEYMVQRLPNLRIVVPSQKDTHQKLQFHQGIWVGNGTGVRTVWMPVTKTQNTNSMYVLDLDDSRRITQQTITDKLDYESFEKLALKCAKPVNLSPGQCHLFNQEIIHGNVNNIEDVTRISVDMRILLKGQPMGKKYPGGYFRELSESHLPEKCNKTYDHVITYAGWNSNLTRNIPLHIQRNSIKPYCVKNNITITENVMEHDTLDWCPNIDEFIQPGLEAIIMLSIYALPEDIVDRRRIYNTAINNKTEVHFANEELILSTKEDIEKIERIRNFS